MTPYLTLNFLILKPILGEGNGTLGRGKGMGPSEGPETIKSGLSDPKLFENGLIRLCIF
jgi:hypothetical protein